ncbi:MAG: hypothetical protein IPH49_01960 [Ignavibacteria bacterium]|nr:hypothetical protein [Ignavibacteria bacterium]
MPAGAEIPSDGIISVVVSRGSTGVRIPSLVGLSLEEAQGILLDADTSTIVLLVQQESGAFDIMRTIHFITTSLDDEESNLKVVTG